MHHWKRLDNTPLPQQLIVMHPSGGGVIMSNPIAINEGLKTIVGSGMNYTRYVVGRVPWGWNLARDTRKE